MERLDVSFNEVISLLQKGEFFSRLLPDDLYWLASRSGVYAWPAGGRIFVPGQPATCFYIVRAGSIQVCRELPTGAYENMAQFIAGDVLGDFDYARQGNHDVYAIAEEPSEVLVFPDVSQSAESIALARPDISARLLLRAVSMISSRVRSTQVLISENAPWVRELRKQMFTDAATGLWHRSYLEEELARKLVRSTPVAFIFFKPDRFKELCDRWGHGMGDVAMIRIAEHLLTQATAANGWALRLKSNETALILPSCSEAVARSMADRVAGLFAGLILSDVQTDCNFQFTVSVGLGMWPLDSPSFRQVADKTQEAMLAAWNAGGKRLHRVSSPESVSGQPSGSVDTKCQPGGSL